MELMINYSELIHGDKIVYKEFEKALKMSKHPNTITHENVNDV